LEFALEIRPAGGEPQIVPLPPSGTITVGRQTPAELVVHDQFMSRVHFHLQCYGMLVMLVDPSSSNGTFVNGVRCRQVYLRPGDTIFAGRTSFRFAPVVNGKPALEHLPSSPGDLQPWQQKILSVVESTCNFAVLDGAISPAILDLLNQSGTYYQSLYEGEQSADIARYGPYLAQLQPERPFLPYLVKAAWGMFWGVFLGSPQSFEETRKHLRRFLIVDNGTGSNVLFRFYDPRVLRVFLPNCEPGQRKEFFGPVRCYFAETEPAPGLTAFTPEQQQAVPLE
jgi:pSer/pThr/pTyr-binding forkhead associated (FHA) protein